MISLKTILTMSILLSVSLSNKVYVFDNKMEFSQFLSNSANARLLSNKKIVVEDDGLMRSDTQPRELDNLIPTCTCTCTESGGHEGGCSNCNHGDDGSENESGSPNSIAPVKEGLRIFNVSDLRPNTMYCLINVHSRKVAKIEADLILKQQNNNNCTGATGLMLSDLEFGDDYVTARIYDKNSQLFLQPSNPSNHLAPISLEVSNEDSPAQKWKFVRAPEYSNTVETWFYIQNIGSHLNFDVRGRSTGRANIIAHPLNKTGAQAFALTVIRNL